MSYFIVKTIKKIIDRTPSDYNPPPEEGSDKWLVIIFVVGVIAIIALALALKGN